MPGNHEVIVNFQGLEDVQTFVVDAEIAHSNDTRRFQWGVLQHMQKLSLRDRLGEYEQDRADILAGPDNVATYRDERIDRNSLRDSGRIRGSQLFRNPQLSIVTSSTKNIELSVVSLVDNTSAPESLPKPFWPLVYWPKMLTPPGLDVPVIGHRRYVTVPEIYSRPNIQPQPSLDVEPGTTIVSGANVLALYRGLRYRHPDQVLTMYLAEKDPDADGESIDLARLLHTVGRVPLRNLNPNLHGDKVTYVQKRVGDALEAIERIPGAEDVIQHTAVSRITKASDRQHRRAVLKGLVLRTDSHY